MTDSELVPKGHTVVVWEDAGLELKITARRECSNEFIQLIEDTRFGSSGLRYRRLDVAQMLKRRATYLSLTNQHKLIGSYVLESTGLQLAGRKVPGIYRSMLCVAAGRQKQGLGRLLVNRTLDWLDQKTLESPRTLLSFGFIEKNNRTSLKLLCGRGGNEIGSLHTQLVYRQWPRKKIAVVRLGKLQTSGHQGSNLLEALRAQYSDCALVYDRLQANDYFAVIENKQIVAGAHARLVRINFDRIGKPWDFLSEHLFKHVGPVRRRFNPREFTYLKLDGVIAQPGSGAVWNKFLDSLLAEHGAHMAMFTLDPSSRVSQQLSSDGLFGRMAKATRQELVLVANTHSNDGSVPVAVPDGPLGLGPFGQ